MRDVEAGWKASWLRADILVAEWRGWCMCHYVGMNMAHEL
jgi:hypothetical protein